MTESSNPRLTMANSNGMEEKDTVILIQKCFSGVLSENEKRIENAISISLIDIDEPVDIVDQTFCGSYPPSIGVPGKKLEIAEWKKCFAKSGTGRARSRFCVPAIWGKVQRKDGNSIDFTIFRSAALVQKPELLLRRIQGAPTSSNKLSKEDVPSVEDLEFLGISKTRFADESALNKMGVNCIADLMVEDRLEKLGGLKLKCASSEKVNRYCYKSIAIFVTPYPGFELLVDIYRNCTIIRDQKEKKKLLSQVHTAMEITKYEWDTVKVQFTLPNSYSNLQEISKWEELQKSWSMLKVTQEYTKLFLQVISHPNSDEKHCGLLFHCISGWDRTPIWVCIFRILLWAEGLVHKSLDAASALYLTISYDWLLFGHPFAERVKQKAEVMLFCFIFLDNMKTDEFSFQYYGMEGLYNFEERKKRLSDICAMFFRAYSKATAMEINFV